MAADTPLARETPGITEMYISGVVIPPGIPLGTHRHTNRQEFKEQTNPSFSRSTSEQTGAFRCSRSVVRVRVRVRCSYGARAVFVRCSCGVRTVFVRCSYGVLTVFVRCSYGTRAFRTSFVSLYLTKTPQ